MTRPVLMLALALFALAACGGGDDNDARAGRLSEETAGAVFNGGLSGTLQKGQSVTLDGSLTLTQTRIACILDEGRIPQIADCGPESGWTSVSAKIPLKHVEPGSISVASPDRGRGQDGLLVYFACRKDAGQCVSWTNPMPSSANGGILCKTQESCEKAAEDLAALVALAQPDAKPAPAGGEDAKAAGLVETMGEEVAGAWFNNGTAGSIERHKSLALENGALKLTAEFCLGTDGRTLDIARCGSAEFNWIAMTATVDPRELDAGSVSVGQAVPEHGETGMMVTARCWKYAGKCARWTAPISDQTTLNLNCKTPAGCDALKAALTGLLGLAQRQAADQAGGPAGLAARMQEGRDAPQVSQSMVAVKKGGAVSVDAGGVLRMTETSCFLGNATADIAATCAARPGDWTTQETAVALADLDPSAIEDSSAEPEELGYTVYLRCRADRGECMTQTSTGAFPDRRTVSGTNLLCRDSGACSRTAADLVTLVETGRK